MNVVMKELMVIMDEVNVIMEEEMAAEGKVMVKDDNGFPRKDYYDGHSNDTVVKDDMVDVDMEESSNG